MATATQLRGATIRVSQLQAQARKSAQRAYEQVKQTQKTPTAQDTQKAKDLYTAAKMVLSGKGESNVSAQTKKYEEAIRYPWSPAYQSLSPEEKKVVSQLNEQFRAGVTEAKQAKEALKGLKIEVKKEEVKLSAKEQLESQIKAKTGTYDISTKTYTSPKGEKYSMAQAPKGAVIESDLSRLIETKVPKIDIKIETQRYKDLGYTTGQSKMLAEESIKQGGKSFTKSESERIIQQKGYLKQIKEEGLLPPTKRKVMGATEKVLTKVGEITEFPLRKTYETSPLGILLSGTKAGESIKLSTAETLGEGVGRAKDSLNLLGKASSSGWKNIFFKLGVPLEKEVTTKEYKIPLNQRSTLMTTTTPEGNILNVPNFIFVKEETKKVKTGAGLFTKAVEVAPEVVAWTLAPEIMAGVEVVSSAEKLKKLDKEADQVLNKQYQEYSKQEPKEGYRLLTKEEFFKQYKTETINQLRQEAVVSGGLSLAFLGLSAGARAYKAVTRPVVKYRQAEQVEFFREVSYVSPKGKISRYEIFQFKPEAEMKVTTWAREKLGLKPKIDWTPITKPQIKVTKPALGSWVIGDKSYIAETGKLSKVPYGLKTEEDILKFYKTAKYTPKRDFFAISGKGEQIKPSEIFKLGKPEQYTWLGKEKIIVQKEGEKFIQSALESKRYYGKVGDVTQIYTPDKYLKQLGKTSETYYTASKIRPILEVAGEQEFKLYEAVTRFKPTIKPFYRASGKIGELKGTILEFPLKEPSKIGGDFISLGKGGAKKTTIIKEIIKPVEKVIPKITKTSIPKVKVKPVIFKGGATMPLVESLYPTYVGGTQVPESKVASFTYPLYEEQQQFTFQNLGMQGQKLEFIQPLKPQIKTDIITITKPKLMIKEKTKPVVKMDLGLKEQTKTITKIQPKVIMKEMMKMQQKQIQKQLIKIPLRFAQKFKPSPTPKPPIPKQILFPSPTIPSEKISAKEKLTGLFEVFTKSKGKFVSVGFGKTEEEAGKKLGKELFSGLEASGFVVEKRTGRKISFEKLGLGDAFRKSKQKGKEFVAVQKRSKRLLSGVERRKIQKERKKSKNIKWI